MNNYPIRHSGMHKGMRRVQVIFTEDNLDEEFAAIEAKDKPFADLLLLLMHLYWSEMDKDVKEKAHAGEGEYPLGTFKVNGKEYDLLFSTEIGMCISYFD